MTREEWLQSLAEVATDPEAAPGPRVRALELIGYSEGWVERFRRRWWHWLIPAIKEEVPT